MKMLITGAGGFIASHLTEALLHREHNVRALVHYNSRANWGYLEELPHKLRDKLDVRPGDVADPRLMKDLVAGCDLVLHLAALIGIPYSYHAPASYLTTNIAGTLNVLEACREAGVQRLIVTSTSEVYGTARYTPIDELHPLQAQSPYAASKIAADKLAESFFCSYNLPIVILRPFNTYGPRQSARAVIPTVLTQALAGAKEIHLGNLEPRRDLTFVDDTVRAFILAAEAPNIEGRTVHFGQGKAISIGELAQRCVELVGSDARIVTVTERQRPQKSEVGALMCDPSEARQLLGWEPKISLDEGLRRTADYVATHLEQYKQGDHII